MRVGILLPPLERALSGIGYYTVELVRALSVLPAGPSIALIAPDRARVLADLALETWRLRGCQRFPMLIAWGGLQLPPIIRRARLDVLHDLSGAAPFAWIPRPVKCVATIYDTIPYSLPGYSHWVDTLNYLYHLPHALKRADAVLTISESARHDIAKYLKVPFARIHPVGGGKSAHYHPVDAERIAAARAAYHLPEDYLLFVGALTARKNVARILEALARIRPDHPAVKLVLVGERHRDILSQIQMLGLHEQVTLAGYVPEDDLPAIYSGARAFVFPSLYEGFGLPVIEAMACGVPVVTSMTSSLPDVAGDAALLVDPADVTQIAAAIRRVLTDEALSKTLRERGLVRAAGFTWVHVAHQTNHLYQQIMDSDL